MVFLFYLLFFFTPLILWPYTSELFEFNKMVFVYLLTVLIVAVWLFRCLVAKRFIFRHTILDVPLLVFLGSQFLSTIFSIDIRTSILGYYSRLNGGLLSTISYLLLYWAFVSNMDSKKTFSIIRLSLTSAVLVSLYGILQHFGIDKNLWVQDVQNRVFSTLGQPNWLAAWIVALSPITWALTLKSKIKNQKSKRYFILASLFFLTLLYTKSRSGILGFTAAFIIFWLGAFWLYRKTLIKQFIIFSSSFLVISLLAGFPFSPTRELIPETSLSNEIPVQTGGTESGTIRKIVWRGAIDIWKHYPLLGSGVETFAFSYYQFRPKEHNLVSEWDFLYNKAHNEYLNYLATTGSLGTFAYIVIILFSLLQISNFKFLISKQIPNSNSKNSNINHSLGQLDQLGIRLICLALLSGYVSILVTNFFGFSVVAVNLLFFLFPAMAITLGIQRIKDEGFGEKIKNQPKAVLAALLLVTGYWLLVIGRYWYADLLFARGRQFNRQGNYPAAFRSLQKALKLSPGEALYHNELAQIAAEMTPSDNQFRRLALTASANAVALSPANVNLWRNRATLFLKLARINPQYLQSAKEALLIASQKAPTYPRIFYDLALINLRLGQIETAITDLQKTLDLKPNYKEARFVYALVLIDQDQTLKAKEELTYILERIDPNDEQVKEKLEMLK